MASEPDMPELPPLPADMTTPTVWCPIELRVHADVDLIEDQLLEWAQRMDLLRSPQATERFTASLFGRFAAYTYPDALDLPLVGQWNAYNWFVDDALDEAHAPAEFIHRLLAFLPVDDPCDTPAADGPLDTALRDLWLRTAPPRSQRWRRRFVGHYRDWMVASMRHRQHRPTPPSTVAEFTQRRRLHSGVELSVDLNEAGDDHEIPDQLILSHPYGEMRRLANDATSWHNDLYSVRKELQRGDTGFLPAALIQIQHCSWQEAMQHTATMSGEATAAFLTARDDLYATAEFFDLDTTELRYASDLLAGWIVGSLRWHETSGRYHAIDPAPAGAAPTYFQPHLLPTT